MKKILFSIIGFITSLLINAQAPVFQWAKKFGGNSSDYGQSIALDIFGNVYTTGAFEGTVDFDPSVGTFNLTASGGSQVFISKFDSNGNFVWAKNMGPSAGSLSAYGFSIRIDPSGNIYTTGYFQGTADFDPGAGIFNLTTSGFNDDIFISKLNSSGNFIWAKSMGGSSYDDGLSIAIDASSNVYTTGYFEGTADFDPGAGIYTLTPTGFHDIFISKLDSSGNFLWAKSMEGMGGSYDNGWSNAVDPLGNLCITGGFQGTVDFDPDAGVFNLSSAGASDIFILKLDSSGNFMWAKQIGGTSSDVAYSISIDVSGNIYTTGQFSGFIDFDPGSGIFNLSSPGGTEIFISKLDSSGNFILAKKMGGASNEGGSSIAVDAAGNIYSTGFFNGTADFDPGAGIFNLTAGLQDIFISQLDSLGNFMWAKNMGGTGYNGGNGIAIDPLNNVYTIGYFSGTTDFNPDAGTLNLSSTVSSYDIFAHKMSQILLGITEYHPENNVLLYPNPSSNQLFLEYDLSTIKKATFVIYDITGKILFESILKGGKQTEEIAGLQFPNGIYLYKIITSDNNILKQSKLTIIK